MSSYWIEVDVPTRVMHISLPAVSRGTAAKETVEPTREQWNRSTFFKYVWAEFLDQGLVGVLEGSVDARENVFQMGTESQNLDWIHELPSTPSKLYFQTFEQAVRAGKHLKNAFEKLPITEPVLEEDQDWDAVWKRSFSGVL